MQAGFIQFAHKALGELFITENRGSIVALSFEKPRDIMLRKSTLLLEAKKQVLEYLNGVRLEFELPLKLTGTDFQQKAWQALTKIPYGQTWSYTQQAQALCNPKAVRAVGVANSKNPIAIIVPCHRVIGASGKLTGYAGGLDKKEILLKLEASNSL